MPDNSPPNEPSTIIDTTQEHLRVVRSGDVTLDAHEHWTTHSAEETVALGKMIAQRYKSFYGYQSVIFSLAGEMGAGKTQFTKGLAQGLGITDMITSPTYTYSSEYTFMNEGKTLPFIHIDAWRLRDESELMDLGIHDFIAQKAVISLEWPHSGTALSQQHPLKTIWLEFTYGPTETERLISLKETL